ncbi:pimeloyl-ACP methyl ester carboxylesterase [Caulobacter ginsengisoli]|uniref:Pimeloyl-ACP methyl ester carboxylesterase n=1 Tax=Caulobacter ginsengisoli TaxID=400775 RepID=A0ABU0ITF4_9CAUL|nr:alpha/beta hydrolase [Caulobacter ginsengisoli]MDQ0465280.1 pimeloyl-ACP methyl ester carboxylesterase [Caulobacter ginsengisoli]
MKTLLRILGGLALLVVAMLAILWVTLQRPDLPWKTLQAKYQNAASRYVDLPGGLHVHYRDQGNPKGPVLVLVHGFSANVDTWEPWVKRLGGTYRIVSLDLPGHGLTQAPPGFQVGPTTFLDVVQGVVDHLKLQKFVLAGNSMGGAVAWNYALVHPERLDGLVLVDAGGWAHPQEGRDGPVIFKVMANPIGRALLHNLDARGLTKAGLEDAYLDKTLVTDALVDRYVDLARAPGHRDILFGLQATFRDPATPQKLAVIKIPTLVMHGRQDKLVPFADGEAFAKAIPGATLDAYGQVGHVPMEQIPDRSAANLDSWIKLKVYPPKD